MKLWSASATCSGVPFDDDLAAFVAAERAEVDDVVGVLHDVEVVLDDDDGVAGVDETVEDAKQGVGVLEREAGRRLVEDVERAAGGATRQLGGQLDALRLAAGERRRGLAEPDVAEADGLERLQLRSHLREGAEEVERLVDGHVQHVGDVLAVEEDLQRLAVVALALADLAGHGHVGQELHLDLDVAVAGAGLAAAALDVEGEATGRVAAHSRLRDGREELADGREGAGVGGRIRARRAADRRLVDVDDLVDVLQAGDAVAVTGPVAGAVEDLRRLLVEDVVDQRALAGAGDAGDADELAERDRDVDVLEVVLAGALDGDGEAVARASRFAAAGSGGRRRGTGR